MQFGNILFQIMLCLLMDPLLEIMEVEGVRIRDLSYFQPFQKEWKIVSHFLAVENAVDHVAAEKTKFDFVASVRMDLFVFVDGLEDMRSGGSISEFKLFEGLLGDFRFVTLAKILDRHLTQHMTHLTVNILEVEMSLHVFLL